MNSQAISRAPVAEAEVTARGGSIRRSRRWALILAYVCLSIFAVFFLFPPYYMIITSFKTDVEISTLKGSPWIINESPTLYHYKNLLTNTRFPTFFLNTVTHSDLSTETCQQSPTRFREEPSIRRS